MMSKPLKWFGGLLLDNFGWKILALLIAVVLWALVASEPELSTFATVRLEYKNLPDELEISSEPVTSVSLEMRGPSGVLGGLSEGGVHPAVIVDMSGLQPGYRTFSISDGNVKLPRGVRLVRAYPSEVRFRFERRMKRTVPVQVKLTGEGQNGYILAHMQFEPKEVEISGPSSQVIRTIAAETDPVDVSTVVGAAEFRVNAFATDAYVRVTSKPQVIVKLTMKKR